MRIKYHVLNIEANMIDVIDHKLRPTHYMYALIFSWGEHYGG